LQCGEVALLFFAGAFPVILVVPPAVLYLESPTKTTMWRVFSLCAMAVLWMSIIFADIDLAQLHSAAGNTLYGILILIGILLSFLIILLVKIVAEHMLYQQYQLAKAKRRKSVKK
jgi:hypothetical protein